MNIAINISARTNAHKDRGIGVYTKELVDALVRYQKQHTYIFFEKTQNIPGDADVVAYPFFDPFFLTLPLYKPKPTVVTVHDLIPLVFPAHFPRGIKGEIKWQLQKWSLMGAKRIVADSFCTQKDIVSIVGFHQKKIDVVPLAASSIFHPSMNIEQTNQIRKKYHLPKTYAFYIGGVNWNKNILGLLRGWKTYKQHQPQGTVTALVLAGKEFNNTTIVEVKEITQYIKASGLEQSVVIIGRVADDDLPVLYQSAVVTIVPSLYEGFGLPILEAMASGGIVAATDFSSVPEIIGPSMVIDATSADSIARAIDTSSKFSVKTRREFVEKGIVWASKFSWKKTAEQTVLSYEKALA